MPFILRLLQGIEKCKIVRVQIWIAVVTGIAHRYSESFKIVKNERHKNSRTKS